MSNDHVWCWRCGERRDETDRYVHRADNPVLKHDRCDVCNDVLMPYPQPTLAEKRTQLGVHLREAMQWTGILTTEEPTDEQDLALREIHEFLLQAHHVYVRQLDSTELYH